MIEDNIKYILNLSHYLINADGLMDDVTNILKEKEEITIKNLIIDFLDNYQKDDDKDNVKCALEGCIRVVQADPQKYYLFIRALDPNIRECRQIKGVKDNQGYDNAIIIPTETKAIRLFEDYKDFSESLNRDIPYKGLYLQICADTIM